MRALLPANATKRRAASGPLQAHAPRVDNTVMNQDRRPIVVALGGNMISPAGGGGTIGEQFAQTRRTAAGLSPLLRRDDPVVITHGNGPQVGSALRRVELSSHEVYPLPLGICVADLQGGMGYMIAQCLTNELRLHGMHRTVCTLVTTVEVDADDPALANPTKPVGSFFDAAKADHYRRSFGWNMVHVPGRGYRRVVPSPLPRAIVELDIIRTLLAAGAILVAAGGGGIPVVRDADGTLHGREAVIDKDLATGLLARTLGAGALVILTDVEQVFVDYGTPQQRGLDRLGVEEAKALLAAGQFPAGSMGPKITAAVQFLEAADDRDARVVICGLENLHDALAGRSGTAIEAASGR
jgi:carbamate kinase